MVFRKFFVATLLCLLLISFIKSVHSGSGANENATDNGSQEEQKPKEVREKHPLRMGISG